jgi:hypothetical protein
LFKNYAFDHKPLIIKKGETVLFKRSFVAVIALRSLLKGIVSPDWKGLQMISLDRFEVYRIPLHVYF